MSESIEVRTRESAVLDPTLRWGRRRWFHQPASGPGRRAFTARSAVHPGRTARLHERWQDARDRETVRRANRIWF